MPEQNNGLPAADTSRAITKVEKPRPVLVRMILVPWVIMREVVSRTFRIVRGLFRNEFILAVLSVTIGLPFTFLGLAVSFAVDPDKYMPSPIESFVIGFKAPFRLAKYIWAQTDRPKSSDDGS